MTEAPRSVSRKRRGWLSPIWLVPVMAGALAGYLIYKKVVEAGPKIEIVFRDASGLEAGKTDIRYLGVRVGGVTALRVTKSLHRVVAEVELDKSAAAIATKGARFWIVRPQVSAGSVSGLSTLISGDYIEAKPGDGTEDEDRFRGLDEAPAEKYEKRDLEIILTSPRLAAAHAGTPIFYRGLQVGIVNDARLASDARSIRIRAFINQAYRALVRDNSQFWNAGGIEMHFGLMHGLEARAKSVKTLVSGGVAFATPDQPGKEVEDGHPFTLNDKEDPKWEKWSPAIKIGDEQGPIESPEGAEEPSGG